MDFVQDALSDGRRFQILAVVDDDTRESLCLVADTWLPGGRVIRELEALIARRGLPRQCVADNGPAFNGLAMLGWAQDLGLEWPPARRVPERDAVHTLAQARIELEEWRRD